MRAGRNDPCPCGSGRKYKKCCLAADMKAPAAIPLPARPAKETIASATPLGTEQERLKRPALAKPPVDPRIAAFNARWDEFENQDYEGRIELFLSALDDKESMDAETAFAMLSKLFAQAAKHNERERFDQVVTALRKRVPEAYEENAVYCLSWLVSNALATGRPETLAPLARELGVAVAAHLDMGVHILDQLDYHGQLDPLREIMHAGWPEVKESDTFEWAQNEFAERAVTYELFHHLLSMPSPPGEDPILLERIAFFFEEPRIPYLIKYVDHATGSADRSWTLSDFEILPVGNKKRRPREDGDKNEQEARVSSDPGTNNLFYLSVEFLGYLHREEGVPYTKGELARKELVHYLVQRGLGELEPGDELFERGPRGHKPKTLASRVTHPLCPDRASLDRYLAGLVGFMNGFYVRASASLELVPAWLCFLERRQLLETGQRQQTLASLKELHAMFLKLGEAASSLENPAVVEGLKTWPGEKEERPAELCLTAGPEAP
jgi:hypothetical protein